MDRYTKFILTVIAMALVWIAVRDTNVPRLEAAQAGVQRVDIVRVDGVPIKLNVGASQSIQAIPVAQK